MIKFNFVTDSKKKFIIKNELIFNKRTNPIIKEIGFFCNFFFLEVFGIS